MTSTTRQSKNLTREEVIGYRAELQDAVRQAFQSEVRFGRAEETVPDPYSGHYIRAGEYESAEIKVDRMEDGRYHVSGLALWGKTRESGPNLGELDFVAEITAGQAEYTEPRYEREPYHAAFLFENEQLVVSEENWVGVFGMNVGFAGKYSRAT